MRKLIKWAEDMDTQPISEDLVFKAVGDRMTEDQIYNMASCIWGFLAKALSGPAMNISNGAEDLNGLDAWRRVVGYITSGKGVQLEDMRREVKFMNLKPITSLEDVEARVAEFINTQTRYETVGGTVPGGLEKKAALLAIPPKAAADNLL